jgi:hypothetical protein
MTEAELDAWRQADIAAGWVPGQPEVAQSSPRRQETRVIINRLTDAERAALFGSTNTGIRTLVAIALATGVIQEDDPDFAAGVAGLDALGIIAASRWDALLAP